MQMSYLTLKILQENSIMKGQSKYKSNPKRQAAPLTYNPKSIAIIADPIVKTQSIKVYSSILINQMKESKRKNLHSTFGKAGRFPKQQFFHENLIINESSQLQKSRGPTFPKGQRIIFHGNQQTPGPGNYNISEAKVIKSQPEKAYKVNKEFLDYMNSRPKSVQQCNPGPGTYELGSTLRKRGISFTRSRIGSLRISQSPGPGQYTISRPISRVQ
ncbi:unnamed protein product [Paramecium primaurelia]|uniref:Uncharacterized protein n=1 Tax=Paramecium primaurelia TaxID=5886 RepID=A0A8S1QCE0_PARPR|nr:unnamed protein product [Paramecium primaurelia]